jgi:hypothetical protein
MLFIICNTFVEEFNRVTDGYWNSICCICQIWKNIAGPLQIFSGLGKFAGEEARHIQVKSEVVSKCQ